MVEAKDKILSILMYIFFIIGLIWYLVDKSAQNEFNKHHLKQALNLIVITIVLNILITIFAFIPVIGWILSLIGMLLGLIIFVLVILQIIAIIQDKQEDVMLIGGLAHSYLTF